MRPEGSGVRTPAPSGRCFPGARLRCQPMTLPHASAALAASPRRPFVRSDLGPTSVTWRPRGSRAFRPSHRSALRPPSPRLRRTTTASADFSLQRPCGHRRPFRRKARSPRVRPLTFAARPPDLRRLALVTTASRSTARSPCSAPPRIRSPVRRPAASLPASFTPASRCDALRFASLAVTSLREDFHLQVDAHAGRTKRTGRGCPGLSAFGR